MSRGVLYMVASAFGFAAMSALVKVASARLPAGELVLARSIATFALSYLMVRRAGVAPWGNDRGRLLTRGALGCLALICYYLSLVRLPLADAVTLQNTVPLFTAGIAWWMLDERVGRAGALAIGLGGIGVALVVQPSGASDPLGIAIALVGAATAATAYVTVRKLSRTEHPLVIVMYLPLVSIPLVLPWAALDLVWPTPREWLLLVAIGATTQLGQVFLTMGLAAERAGRATAVGYLQVCFAMAWQVALFGQVPPWATLAGAALIIGGTVAVSAAARSDPA